MKNSKVLHYQVSVVDLDGNIADTSVFDSLEEARRYAALTPGAEVEEVTTSLQGGVRETRRSFRSIKPTARDGR